MVGETYVSTALELGEVQGGLLGDLDVLEDDGVAAGVLLHGGGGIGEGASGSTGVEKRRAGNDRAQGPQGENERNHGGSCVMNGRMV